MRRRTRTGGLAHKRRVVLDNGGHFRDFGDRCARPLTVFVDQCFAIGVVDAENGITNDVTLLLLNVFALRTHGFQHFF